VGVTPFVLGFLRNQPTPISFVMTTTTINGVQFNITRLPVAHGPSALRWADRIKGGSSRVRTHGGAAGSRGTSMSTNASALGDVR
jgi:hypothetical protein